MVGRPRPTRERRGTPWDLLVVGLGNPGPKYADTLHNVGVAVIDEVASRFGESFRNAKEEARVAEIRMGDSRVALAFPQTFMNESGRSVAPLCRRYGISDPAHLVVVHDELDLEPGRLQVKVGGGLAGHNGLRSLRDHLGHADFARIRIGVGKPPGGASKGAGHVLSPASRATREIIAERVVDAADAIELIASDGLDAAMQRFNAS